MPPPAAQKEIIERIEQGRAEIAAMRQSAKDKAEAIEKEIEKMILGKSIRQ